jgi:hypothetical protein
MAAAALCMAHAIASHQVRGNDTGQMATKRWTTAVTNVTVEGIGTRGGSVLCLLLAHAHCACSERQGAAAVRLLGHVRPVVLRCCLCCRAALTLTI